MEKIHKILILAAVALLAGLLLSCRPAAPAEETFAPPTEEVTPAEEAVPEEVAPVAPSGTIEFWSYMTLDAPGLYEYIDKFNESQDRIKVVAKYIPFEEFKRQLTTAIAGGTPPDFVMVDNPDHASYIEMGAFADLTDKIAEWAYGQEDFYPGPWQSSTWEGRQYGVPIETNTLALFYNADMFEEAGLDPAKPPTTWEELTEYAAKLTKGGVYGLSVSAVASEEGTFQWLPFLQQNGGDILHLDSPEAVEALKLWVDWVQKGYVSKEILNMDQWSGVRVQFMNGQAAMMINGPWNVEPLKADVPDLNWKVALLPGRKIQSSAMGGVNFAILKGKNVDAAWEFITWLYKPENIADFWYKFGSLPVMPEIAETAPYWKGDPVYEVFLEQMKYAAPRGPHPRWSQISEAIYTAMQEALTGVKTPEQALADAAKKVEEITK